MKNPKQTTTTKPQDAGRIVAQVIKITKDYSVKDLAKWRRAMRSAENIYRPDRSLLYDLYDDLCFDNHFIFLRRRTHIDVTGVPFQVFNKAGEVNEELTGLFKKKWFRNFCQHAIDAQFFGFSLLELQYADVQKQELNFALVDRKHVVPECGAWKVLQHDVNYRPYRDNSKAMQYLIEVGEPDDLGLLNKLAPMILYKKVMQLVWTEFAERFGMPLAKAKTNTRDIAAVNKLQNFLKDMASKSYAIIDNAEELDFVDGGKADSYNVFDKGIERCNMEMSKAIRLQTLSSEVSMRGTKALGEVHKQADEDVSEYNRDYIADLVNENLMPLLALHGFKTEGQEFRFMFKKTITAETFAQDQWLDEHFDIDPGFWAHKYRVPIRSRRS